MKKLIGVMAALLLASCGGVGPDSGYTQTEKYDASIDFLTAAYAPFYIISGSNIMPLDYPKEKADLLTPDEKLLLELDYYTPDNVQKIMDRITRYLEKAKAELAAPEYEKLLPWTMYRKVEGLPIKGLWFKRWVENAWYPGEWNPDETLVVAYGDWSSKHPIPKEIFGDILDKIWASVDTEKEVTEHGIDVNTKEITWSPRTYGGVQSDATPIRDALFEATNKTEALWKQVSDFESYKKHLKTLKSDPNNPIVQVMKSFQIRGYLSGFLSTSVAPKNQDTVKQKVEAFLTAWGL